MRFIHLVIRYITFVLAIAGVIAMVLIMQQIHGQDSAQIPPPPVPPPVKPYEGGVAATGILEALSENVSIGVPAPGLVTDVKVKVWDKVKKDAPLLILDDRELRASLLKQQAAITVSQAKLDVSRAQLSKMQDMLDRLKSVTDQRAISQDDLKNRTNDVAVAKAEVSAAEAQLEAAKADVKQTELLIERLTVRAPKEGTILQVNIRGGEYASIQNKLAPLILGDVDTFQVRVDVDEQNALAVREGQAATAFLKGDSKTPYPLIFVRIEPFVIPKVSLTGASTERVDTRVLQVIYRLQKPANTPLYVGQQVDVFIAGK
ncbi:MAG: efflux RND transporter periplasmic adaptor subunit [Verrucomicrobiaceae bacterium]|nr:efflux RND transporter periplasmic adaptor subunit [Verrucomicrobiaceae bacterium]